MTITIVYALHLCIFENFHNSFKNQIGYNNGEDEPFMTYIHCLVLINAECDWIIPNFKSTKFMFLS